MKTSCLDRSSGEAYDRVYSFLTRIREVCSGALFEPKLPWEGRCSLPMTTRAPNWRAPVVRQHRRPVPVTKMDSDLTRELVKPALVSSLHGPPVVRLR